MARKTATNIVEVWNWLINVLEDGTLSATEQAVLVHVIAKLNRNLWEPTKINAKLIAAAVDKDPRTIKAALAKFVDLKILNINEEAYYFGEQFKHNPIPSADTGRFRFRAGTGKGNAGKTEGAVDATDSAGGRTESAGVVEDAEHSGSRRKLFNAVSTE